MHESRCITVHKLVNELGTFWCVSSNFDTRLNLRQIVLKFLPCVLTGEQKQLELHQCLPGHSEEMSDIHTSFQKSLQMTDVYVYVDAEI